ncbi:MAG: IPExxxVDY family protein [Chlorobi bacterium]|nr:IPExxxVDY family protein [Chlorobiota bacterium]
MAKKLKVESNLFEGYSLLALVTPLKDYRLAYFINDALNFQLKKYDDLRISGRESAFSWYYYSEGSNYLRCMLISNMDEKGRLIPGQRIDFFLLIKNIVDDDQLEEILSKLRKVSGINAAFEMNMSTIRNMDVLLEAIEMHELDQVIKPLIKKSKPPS